MCKFFKKLFSKKTKNGDIADKDEDIRRPFEISPKSELPTMNVIESPNSSVELAIEAVDNKDPNKIYILEPDENVSKPKTLRTNYNKLTVPELKSLAKERGKKGYSKLSKSELVALLKKK